MKRHIARLLAALLLLAALPVGALAAAGDRIPIDARHFPDAKFRKLVRQYTDKNGDGYLSAAERSVVKQIDVSGKGISSLEGIQYFTKVTTLYCSNNKLEAVNLSANTALRELLIFGNRLTSLNVRKLTKLRVLYVNKNRLKALDVSQNAALRELDCADNKLTRLSLKGNAKLYAVRCDGNAIASLDITPCPELKKAMRDMELHGDGSRVGTSAGDFYGVNIPASCKVVSGGKTLYDPKAQPALTAATITVGVKELARVVSKSSTFPGLLCKASFSPKGVAKTYEGVEYEPGYLAVQGVKVGTTRLTLTTPAGKKVACTVNVKKAPTKVTLKQPKLSLKKGGNATLEAALSPANSASALTYSSENTKVAKVSAGGVVTAVGPGKTRVGVKTYNGKTAWCEVNVK